MSNLIIQGLPDNPPQLPKLFDVPQGMDQYMRPLSGLVMFHLQQGAMAGGGNHNTAFWGQCVQSGFQFQGWKEVLYHAAALAWAAFTQNQSVTQNLYQWLNPVAEGVSKGYPLVWASNHAQQYFQNLDQGTMMTVRNAIAGYTSQVTQAIQLFQSGINNTMMMNTNQFGMMGNQGGMSPQMMQMMTAIQNQNQNGMWGTGGQMGGGWFSNNQSNQMPGMNGFNSNVWGQQLANNQYGQQQQNNSWQYNQGGQQQNILNAGRVGSFESADQGNGQRMSPQEQQQAIWTSGQSNTHQEPQNNFQAAQTDTSFTWGVSPTTPPPSQASTGGFTQVGNVGQSSMDAMLALTPNEINAAAATAHLTHFGTPETAPMEQSYNNQQVQKSMDSPMPTRTKVINPSNLKVRIPRIGGTNQVHLKMFNPETEYSVCDVENNVVVNQEIRQKETDVDFSEQNTAKFLPPKGTDAGRGLETDGLTMAAAASGAMNSIYLDTALEQIRRESTAEELTGDGLTKALVRIGTEKVIRLEGIIEGTQSLPTARIQNFMAQRGVDAIFNKAVIVADMIEMDSIALTPELATVFDEIVHRENTVASLVFGFNRLRTLMNEQNWNRLNTEITKWINEELYTRWGLSMAIDDFSSQFEELSEILQGEHISISYEHVKEWIQAIKSKFLTVYRQGETNGEYIYTEENGYSEDTQYNQLGIMNRYVCLPVYSKDLGITSNSTSGIVTGTNQFELYNILATSLPNLSNPAEATARNFIVTLNGDLILVNRPREMTQFLLTRLEAGYVTNPLL